ncbi:MAG: lipopolysaccharide heptosyltransferase II [Candidatus Omnitrophica bacterium CG11_big_fil_rev_8_21_14_0_20_63_9]|nr:MAG: lipopolysaccharide heptosyltransferase II [Candidatus Omnitrophica bacterium CG11_big_fil_rev_8_21_14_0_20_63_9]
MHILQLLPSLEVGGVERGVLDLAKGFIARGHRVTVVSSGGALVPSLLQLGAQHVELPLHAKSPAAIRYCMPEVAQLIREQGVDIVHARSRVPAWIGWAAARWAQRPFVTTAHGFYKSHPASRVMVWGRLVIAPSEALGRYLIERFRLPRERLRVIPRGVDVEAFAYHPAPEGPRSRWRIGLIGRLSRIKGHEVALRACERLVRKGLPVQLCIAGDVPGSPARAALESLAGSLGLQEHVEWCGIRQDVPALIASMDLMIVPSTYPESFGRSVVEAHAVGRPVIASRIGALAELIRDGETGLLVPPNDPHVLAEAIGRLILDEPLRQRCVQAGRARVEADWTLDRMVERTLAVYDECLTKPRIAVWKLSALGDVVLSTPSLRAIRRQFPQAHISAIVGRAAYEVVARCPYLNNAIIYDPKRKDRGIRRQWSWLRRLRREAFDLSIDLQNSRRTHLLAWLAGIPVRAGYRRKFGWLLNRAVRLPRVVLAPVAHQHYLLQQAGIRPDGDALELWPSALDEERAGQLLGGVDPQRPLIAVQPGGSGRWRTKRWPLARWASLCQLLAQRGMTVVVTGGPEETALGESLRSMVQPAPLSLIGQTSLMELACVIKRCQLFLGHDSLALHLAAAVGTPAVALFGPTDPRRHLPPTFMGQVIKKDVFCSPCYSPRCCTITHACMQRISVEEVCRAALALLGEPEAHASAAS